MKFLCEAKISNRSAPSSSRFYKSTIALGFHPANEQNSPLFLMVFSAANKNGIRYKISDNIQKVFTKYIQEGKTTISFKCPEIDLQIKCDSVQLKCFLQTLKLGMEGKRDRIRLGLSTLAVLPQKSHPITKMTITSIADVPIKGYPRTLKSLFVRCRLYFVVQTRENVY